MLEQFQPDHEAFRESELACMDELSSWLSLIIDNVQAHQELKHNKLSYRQLLGKFLATNEEERRKIAREIHDEVNQILLSAKLKLENIEDTFPAEMDNVREKLQIIRSHISHVFDDLHRLSLSLRPPALDELGLPQALEWYTQNLSREVGLPVELKVRGLNRRRPAPVIETELFRIAQEALSNIIKHAQATAATIKLEFSESQIVLLVKDNGKGFDTNVIFSPSGTTQNLGMLGMTERAEICGGSLEIKSAPWRGTAIKVEIPIGSFDWGAY
jgi:signal transduction histidine kinase